MPESWIDYLQVIPYMLFAHISPVFFVPIVCLIEAIERGILGEIVVLSVLVVCMELLCLACVLVAVASDDDSIKQARH